MTAATAPVVQPQASGPDRLLERVRAKLDDEIRRLEALPAVESADGPLPVGGTMVADGARAGLKLRLLRQLTRALEGMRPDDLSQDGAGLGSMLTLEDCVSGEYLEYMLMSGDLVDVAAGQVSLASPIGRAVVGREVGACVEATLPRGVRAFRIVALTTLPAMLGLARPAAARRRRVSSPNGARPRLTPP